MEIIKINILIHIILKQITDLIISKSKTKTNNLFKYTKTTNSKSLK